MTDKIAEYKKRRAARILARLDAKDDNDEGRWVTTENDNRVHLNKNGVPDKGNPFVLAAMTGKKPKLSMNYHQKNVAKAIKTGKSLDVEEALEKLPNGSKILLNGQKYKAEFFNNEFAGGRGVEFVNEEDQDDILQSYEVTDELINNGDVSLEAPDRTEKESETTYEPDIEPDDDVPEDDFETPDSPDDYGGGDFVDVNSEKKQKLDKIVGVYAGGGTDQKGLNDFLDSLNYGEQIKVGNYTFTKQISDETGLDVFAVSGPDADDMEAYTLAGLSSNIKAHAKSGAGNKIEYLGYSQEEPEDLPYDMKGVGETPQESPDTVPDETAPQEAGSASGITSPDFKLNLVKSILALENPDVPYDEWSEKFNAVKELENQIPEGTKIQFGDHKLIKYNNPVIPYMNAETGELLDHSDFIDMIKEGGDFKIGAETEEVIPEAQTNNFEYTAQDFLNEMHKAQNKKDTLTDEEWDKYGDQITKPLHNMVDGAPVGTKITLSTPYGDADYTKLDNGKWFAEGGAEVSSYNLADVLATNKKYGLSGISFGSVSESVDPQESPADNKTNESANVKRHLLDLMAKSQSGNFVSENEWENVLNNLPEGTTFESKFGAKAVLKKDKDGNAAFVNNIGDVVKNNVITKFLSDSSYGFTVDFPKGGGNSSNSTSINQFNFSALQSEVNKLKGQTGLTKADKEQLNNILDDAPVGTTIAFTANGDEYEVEKQSDGKWKENKHGGVYSGYNVANSFVHNSTELESYLPENESKNSDPYNLGEWNPPTTSNQNAANNTSSNTKSWSGTKANGFGAVQEVKSDIDEFVSKHKSGITISKHILGDQLKKLEDGSSVKVGAKTYVKDTDDVGSITFQNSNNEFDTLEPYQLAAKIASKAQTFDNPIIEVNDPANSPKIKKSTNEPVYIPESVPAPKKADNISFSDDDFSQERKDAAVWDTGNGQTFDNVMRGISGKVWQGLSVNGKSALYEYTGSGYRSINNFLRKPDHDGQSEEIQHKMRYRIGQITKAISQSQAPKDMWVQRGIPLKNLKRLFGISDEQFNKAESNGMSSLLDAIKSSSPYGQDEGFMSCGSTKGHGFSSSDVILNIYCPKGTQMLYAEPFSAFGNGGKKSWDGTSKQSWFSSENETILQRGTKLVPTKITKSNGKYYVDVEVIGQEYSDKI